MMSTSHVSGPAAAAPTAPPACSGGTKERGHQKHKKPPKKAKTAKDLRNAAAGATQKDTSRKGANGVKLKRFESVMCDVFSTSPGSNEVCNEALDRLTPRYSKLPPLLDDVPREELVDNARAYWKDTGLLSDGADVLGNAESPWPFDKSTALPQCGQVRSASTSNVAAEVGDVRNNDRALRKELQLSNLTLCVIALLPDDIRQPTALHKNENGQRKFRIVDFAGGTGHLAVPLALLLPHCDVVCVDLKKWSLDLLHRRVDGSSSDDDNIPKIKGSKTHTQPVESSTTQTSKTLSNLSTYHGTIQTYPQEFDIGVSLHACGEASDWVLRKCLEQKASFVVASCCCGKLRQAAKNPYVYQSTGGNEKEITYPQSDMFATLGRCVYTSKNDCGGTGDGKDRRLSSEMFDEIARAADYSELGDLRKPKNACRRAAKSLVEWDRLLYAKECMLAGSDGTAGNVILTRMQPWEASPKNDILVGWFGAASNPYPRNLPDASIAAPEDLTCDADFQVAMHHLFSICNPSGSKMGVRCSEGMSQNDWTAEEEEEAKSQIEASLIEAKVKSYTFPAGMGPRRRKLIHYVAEGMGLRHWGEGKRDSEKRVIVAI